MPGPQLPSRAGLARFGAPAAFLLGVTVAVLLVRAGLAGSEDATPVTSVTRATTTEPAATTRTTSETTTVAEPEPRFYTIERGDTFGSVAADFDTTVERLIELNPGVDTTELRIGQRIRVE